VRTNGHLQNEWPRAAELQSSRVAAGWKLSIQRHG
jgi:hypothetical protein